MLDHEQRQFDLMTVDERTLIATLQDIFLQFVASGVRRQTMSQLCGLDGSLTLLDASKLPALQRSLLSALHCGVFISEADHARYDPHKQANCQHCLCPDDRAHWLQCPRYAGIRGSIENWRDDLAELPDCALYHLLVPRSKLAVLWRDLLWNLEDRTLIFSYSQPTQDLLQEMQHLFLDGTCTEPAHSPLQLAAWAVLNATAAQEISTGPSKGIV